MKWFKMLGGLLLLGAVSMPAQAQKDDKSDSKIKAAAALGKAGPDGKQKLTITIDIDKGWYIYANPVDNDTFAKNRTQIAVKAKDKVATFFDYPKGKVKVLGEFEYKIYETRVVIEGQIQRSAGDTSPLEVAITVNACSHGGDCLLTGTKTLNVP